MFGFGKAVGLVGLDVGSSGIKAVELKRSKSRAWVSRIGVEPLATDVVVDSMIVDSGTASAAIARLFDERKIASREVAMSVSGHSVIVKRITLARMTDTELAERLEVEAAQYVPFDMTDVSVDYQILGENGGSEQMDVLLVAVKRDKILNYTGVLSLAGKTAQIMDVDAFALQNCYEFNYGPLADETVVLLNIGAAVMTMHVVRGSTPLFTRDVHVAGNLYTEAIQRQFHLDYEEAEACKLGRKIPDGATEESWKAIFDPTTETLLREIRRTLDFFRATSDDNPVQRMYVAGGSSRVPGLVEALAQSFGVPVEPLDPFRRLELDPALEGAAIAEANAGQMAIAVGLALRSFESL